MVVVNMGTFLFPFKPNQSNVEHTETQSHTKISNVHNDHRESKKRFRIWYHHEYLRLTSPDFGGTIPSPVYVYLIRRTHIIEMFKNNS